MTLTGGYERRSGIVFYLNRLAIAVNELKRSSVEIGDGVRQLITNQEEIFDNLSARRRVGQIDNVERWIISYTIWRFCGSRWTRTC